MSIRTSSRAVQFCFFFFFNFRRTGMQKFQDFGATFVNIFTPSPVFRTVSV